MNQSQTSGTRPVPSPHHRTVTYLSVFGYCRECRVTCSCGASSVDWGDTDSEALQEAVCTGATAYPACPMFEPFCLCS